MLGAQGMNRGVDSDRSWVHRSNWYEQCDIFYDFKQNSALELRHKHNDIVIVGRLESVSRAFSNAGIQSRGRGL